MVGLFGTLGTATSGLEANQVAMQTSSHNIANTNTDGYSRQRVVIETSNPYFVAHQGWIGTGAQVSRIERISDDFINGQVREQNSVYQAATEKSDVLGQLENIMNEPSDNGILNQMSTLFNSWENLGNNPESGTLRTLVVQNSKTFGDMVTNQVGQIDKLAASTTTSLQQTVSDINQKLGTLQTINNQIYNLTQAGQQPNDLLDQRDQTLKSLSDLADATISLDRYGRASVAIGGQTILAGADFNDQAIGHVTLDEAGTLTVTADQTVTDGATASSVTLTGGKLGGLQDAASQIKVARQQLTNFAQNLTTLVNQTYQNNGPIFEISDTSGFKLSVNNQFIANAQQLVPGASSNANSGDGSTALKIAQLATTKFQQLTTTATTLTVDEQNGQTLTDAYNSIVTQNGIQKQEADNVASAQSSVLAQLENKQQAVSGVSLNEEISDTIRFQKGFQANAKVLSVVSDMLDALLATV